MIDPARDKPVDFWLRIGKLLVRDLDAGPFLEVLAQDLRDGLPHLEVTPSSPGEPPPPRGQERFRLSLSPTAPGGLEVRPRPGERFTARDLETLQNLAALLETEGRRRSSRQEEDPGHGLLRSIIDSASEVIYAKDLDGRFIVVNQIGARRLGYQPEDLLGRTHQEVDPSILATRFRARDLEVMSTGLAQELEYSLWRDGVEKTYLSRKSPWKDASGKTIGLIGISSDITDRKRASEEIRALLKEKEILLQEVHHRIKNNMGTIIALLTMHADGSDDPRVRSSLEEAQNRVYSMMLLYDKLYKTPGFREIPVRGYFSVLIDEILDTFPNRPSVRVEKHLEDFPLPVDQGQQVGILVNELLTNSMKYAFPGHAAGTLGVRIIREGSSVVVEVRDDGVGFSPTEGQDDPGFGMSLVRMMVQGLRGRLEVDGTRGTRVTVRFELPSPG